MQILMQNLIADLPVEDLEAKQKIERAEAGLEQLAPTFSLELAKPDSPKNTAQDNRNIMFVPQSKENLSSTQNPTPVFEALKHIDSPSSIQTADTAKLAYPTGSAVENRSASVNLQDVPQKNDRAATVVPAISPDAAQNLVSNGWNKAAKKVAFVPNVSLSPDANKIVKTGAVDKDARIVEGKTENDVPVAKQVPLQPDQTLLNASRTLQSELGKEAKFMRNVDVEAGGKSGPETPIEPSAQGNTPPQLKKGPDTPQPFQLQQRADVHPFPEQPGKPIMNAPKDEVLSVLGPLSKGEVLSSDRKFDAARAAPLETLAKAPPESTSTDRLSPKDRPTTTSIEILYRPNVVSDTQLERARPTNQEESVLIGSRNVGRVERAEITSPAPLQKPELARRDSRSSRERRVGTAENVEQDVQHKTNENQSLPKMLPVKQVTPAMFASGLQAKEFSSFVENGQVREGGPQVLVDVTDSRREAVNSTKIETFARPVIHQLSHAAKSLGNGSIELKLAPEELGKVRLALTPGETNVTVQIIAERPETLDLIRRNIDLFAQSLKQEGFTDLSFSFGSSGGEQDSAPDRDANLKLPEKAINSEGFDAAKQSPQNLITGHLDIRI